MKDSAFLSTVATRDPIAGVGSDHRSAPADSFGCRFVRAELAATADSDDLAAGAATSV